MTPAPRHARHRRGRLAPAAAAACAAIAAAAAAPPAPAAQPSHPLVLEHCTKCHGGAKRKAGLDLRSVEAATLGGDGGAALVPQHPDQSPLIAVLAPDADPHMPPKKQLGPEEIEALRTWVAHLDAATATAPGTTADPEDPQSATSAAAHRPPSPHAPELPHGVDPALAIDVFLQAAWRADGITPAAATSDAAFARRVFLDVLGRIPTRAELDAFLADTDSAKRANLVDMLTATGEHAAHLARVFDVALLGRDQQERGGRGAWLAFLTAAFRDNRPWDSVAHELISARPTTPAQRGAAHFLYSQRGDHQSMATRTASALLGQQVQCAQCHDHPVSPEIEQRHYWGLVAFFSRSLNVTTPDGPAVAERASGGYAQFSNLEGESSESELVLLGLQPVAEPGGRREQESAEHYLVPPPDQWLRKLGKDEKLKTDLDAVPVPKFSRRAQLAAAVTADNPAFARAMVNRLWALVFGRGLVHPVDQMDSAHPPSHPQLLDWLARDFAASGHDVRRLLRAMLNSQAYQLDSRPPADGAVPPRDEHFARALTRPLSAEVLLRSMRVATGHPPADAPEPATDEAFIAKFPHLFAEVYSPTVQQALFLTNGAAPNALVAPTTPLVARLAALENPEAAAREAFLCILGRPPDAAELARSTGFLDPITPQRTQHLCWALLTSAEFRLNH